MRQFVAALLFFASSALFAAAPASIESSYDVITKGVKIATINEKFTRTGNHYRIENVTKPVGLLALFKPDTLYVVSEGDITTQGLRPLNYVYKRSQETLKNTEANFDWSQSSLMLNDRYGQRVEPQTDKRVLSVEMEMKRPAVVVPPHAAFGREHDLLFAKRTVPKPHILLER